MSRSREQYFNRQHTYVDPLDPLLLNGNMRFAHEYVREDGGSHVLFLDESEVPTNNSSRLGLFKDPDGSVCFLGMYVRDELRGSGAAKAIAQYFLDYCYQRGNPASETATIRKPLIALGLERAGFTPQLGGTHITILPSLQSNPSHTPAIMVAPQASIPDNAIEHSPAGPFYTVIDQKLAARLYPVNGPFAETTIHTRFLPPTEG